MVALCELIMQEPLLELFDQNCCHMIEELRVALFSQAKTFPVIHCLVCTCSQGECSFVSLRDVERVLSVMAWFYRHRDMLFPMMDRLAVEQILARRHRGAEEEMEYEVVTRLHTDNL